MPRKKPEAKPRISKATFIEAPPRKLVMRNLSTRRFVYDRTRRLFTADASDLPLDRLERVGAGFRLLSGRTGKVMVLALTHTEYGPGPDPEVLWWEYRPAAQNHRDDFVVVVYND